LKHLADERDMGLDDREQKLDDRERRTALRELDLGDREQRVDERERTADQGEINEAQRPERRSTQRGMGSPDRSTATNHPRHGANALANCARCSAIVLTVEDVARIAAHVASAQT
jgi:hypothetical protein